MSASKRSLPALHEWPQTHTIRSLHFLKCIAGVAQMVEQLICNQPVQLHTLEVCTWMCAFLYNQASLIGGVTQLAIDAFQPSSHACDLGPVMACDILGMCEMVAQ